MFTKVSNAPLSDHSLTWTPIWLEWLKRHPVKDVTVSAYQWQKSWRVLGGVAECVQVQWPSLCVFVVSCSLSLNCDL